MGSILHICNVRHTFTLRDIQCSRRTVRCAFTRPPLSSLPLATPQTRRTGWQRGLKPCKAQSALASQDGGSQQTSGGSSAAGGAAAASNMQTPSSTATATPPPTSPPSATQTGTVFSIKPIYLVIFGIIFLGGLLFASMSLQLTSEDMGFRDALTKVVRRIFRSIAFRQLVVITVAIVLVRFALNNVLRVLSRWSASPVQWDKSRLYYVMKEVYAPLELLLFIAGCCTLADSFVPQLINVPKATVTQVVRAVLSMSFVIGAGSVVYNLKSRFCKEQAWQCEMQGDVTSQRRWEAYDKLGTFAIYAITTVLAIQALGLEVRSVLAIGGIGGLVIGLAGREICENLLNGFLLMTTMPFEVGDEVMFQPNGQVVEGIVLDVGWYRTTIRSFEREVFVIPNAVFSKNTVLNVTRKMKEWRFYEYLCVRVQDVHKVNAIVQDIRRIVRNDSRIINKLHRRVFFDKLTAEDCKIYLSFYVEATNRDSFMAVKQDLLLAFVDCVERNGAKLATPRIVLDVDDTANMALLGAAAAAYASRGDVPVVQVVDHDMVTPKALLQPLTPVATSSSSSNGKSPSPDKGNGKGGGGGGTGGGGGMGGGGGSSKAAAGAAAGQGASAEAAAAQQQQQQQQQLQPQMAFAAAATGGGEVSAAANAGARSRGDGSSSGDGLRGTAAATGAGSGGSITNAGGANSAVSAPPGWSYRVAPGTTVNVKWVPRGSVVHNSVAVPASGAAALQGRPDPVVLASFEDV